METAKDKMKKALLTTFAAGALAVGGLAAAAPPAHAATTLGGLNLDAYCRATTPNFGSWVWIQSPANVYQWRCSYRWYNAGNPWTYTIGFDMNRACRWTYGGNAYAGFTNYSNPYSWRCYR